MSTRITGTDELRRYILKLDTNVHAIKAHPARIISNRALTRVKNLARDLLTSYPGKPKYPLRWKSDRQRRAVMAKLRKAGNLPYNRTQRLKRSWSVVAASDKIEVINDAQVDGVFYPIYVFGEDQQPFHSDTGWVQSEEQIEQQIINPLISGIDEGIKGIFNG